MTMFKTLEARSSEPPTLSLFLAKRENTTEHKATEEAILAKYSAHKLNIIQVHELKTHFFT